MGFMEIKPKMDKKGWVASRHSSDEARRSETASTRNDKPKTGDKPVKFPHKGRAGFMARKKLAEEAGAKKGWVASSTRNDSGEKGTKRMDSGSVAGMTKGATTPDKAKTGWGKVAEWYHDTVEDKGSYQRDLILPNVIRLLDIKKGETILDLACGEGFFARRYVANGATVVGVDIAAELIEVAKKAGMGTETKSLPAKAGLPLGKGESNPKYYVAGADKIPFVVDNSIDKLTIILALQNIDNVTGTFKECARVLKPGGKMLIVLNHPAFRIPKASGWGWTAENLVQYRRIDKYMSELREKIDMTPGTTGGEQTISFHRPLQYFVKLLGKAGLAITNMEEWVGNRKSQPGPRAGAEDKARAEIPLFMMLEVKKL